MIRVLYDYIKPYGHGSDFRVEIAPKDSALDFNYHQAGEEAALTVNESKQGELQLMYSGGVDSEYTLSLFRDLKIPITPVIVKLLPDYNAHDVAYAFKYCEQRGITPKVIDIDFDRFVESGQMYRTAMEMSSSKFHYAATAYAIGQLDGTVLCGDGEPYIRLDPATQRWNLMVHEYEYALTNYFDLKGIIGTPHFNRYTKDMFYGFLLDPRMFDLANNRVPGKTSSFSSKWIIYNRHSGFNLEERTKYHGYERVEKSPIFENESFQLIEKIVGPQWDGVWSTDYLEFMNTCVQ